jgi:hypothetical protein
MPKKVDKKLKFLPDKKKQEKIEDEEDKESQQSNENKHFNSFQRSLSLAI